MLRNNQKVRITAFRTRFAISHTISCVVLLTKVAGFKQIGYYRAVEASYPITQDCM